MNGLKTKFCLFLLSWFILFNAHSQKVYFQASLGYNSGIEKDPILYPNLRQSPAGTSINYSIIQKSLRNGTVVQETGSYGSGISLKLNVGKNLSDNLALELGLFYNKGREKKHSEFGISNSYKGRMIGLTPLLVLSAPLTKQVYFFKAGPSFQFASAELKYSYSGIDSIRIFSGRPSVGLFLATGFEFQVKKINSFFVELSLHHFSYKPSYLTMKGSNDAGKSYNLNKQDFIGIFPRRLMLPFSSIGLSVGFKFR